MTGVYTVQAIAAGWYIYMYVSQDSSVGKLGSERHNSGDFDDGGQGVKSLDLVTNFSWMEQREVVGLGEMQMKGTYGWPD